MSAEQKQIEALRLEIENLKKKLSQYEGKYDQKAGQIYYHSDYEWDYTSENYEYILDEVPLNEVEKIGVLKRMPYKFGINGELYDTEIEAKLAVEIDKE